MKVRITAGAYGYRAKGSHFITPIFQGETCEVDDAEGKYLIETGAAIMAEASESGPEPTVPDVPDASAVGNLSSEPGAEETPSRVPDSEYLERLSFEELKDFAAEHGIDTKKLRSKQAIRDAIAEAFGEDEVEGGEPPELDVSGVVV